MNTTERAIARRTYNRIAGVVALVCTAVFVTAAMLGAFNVPSQASHASHHARTCQEEYGHAPGQPNAWRLICQ